MDKIPVSDAIEYVSQSSKLDDCIVNEVATIVLFLIDPNIVRDVSWYQIDMLQKKLKTEYEEFLQSEKIENTILRKVILKNILRSLKQCNDKDFDVTTFSSILKLFQEIMGCSSEKVANILNVKKEIYYDWYNAKALPEYPSHQIDGLSLCVK